MNKISLLVIVLVMATASTGLAKDMRQSFQSLEKQRKTMAQKAASELAFARAHAREQALTIKKDRQALEQAIAALKSENKDLAKLTQGLEKKVQNLRAQGLELGKSLETCRAVNKELAGFVHSHAKELKALLVESLQSGLNPNRHPFLLPIINQERFWSMDDLKKMTQTLFDEIRSSGEVNLCQGPIVDRQGRDRTARILTLGNFNGIYVLETESGQAEEIGFLLYSDQSQRFFALSKQPSARMADQLEGYLSGDEDSAPMDISRGGALRRFTHELSLAAQVPKGGPIVWPILVILVLALVILGERVIFFIRQRVKIDPFMDQVAALVDRDDWEECARFMRDRKKGLIPRVLLKALDFRTHCREEMENALQEAILKEIPVVERFLSTLGMLAAIAPLMGLLGTVTGMINTFHVITYYGAGDPRMMSGGISEALVTTMLGLAVAIPSMLCHTLLSRQVETQINQVEEKAVSFVNMVFKARQVSNGNPG
ncbi:MAG: MotA/TolQ/ExbB proton channel family protein [Desulfobacter sp.]|nr:MAG: MotA/TolQ/ExbB proton channel family protein [Desulfobacter sp.]